MNYYGIHLYVHSINNSPRALLTVRLNSLETRSIHIGGPRLESYKLGTQY